MRTETHLWRTIEAQAQRRAGMFQRRVTAADIARATGLSEQLLSKWRYKPTLPKPDQLAALRDGIGVAYTDLLEAALTDREWLPEPAPGVISVVEDAARRHMAEVEQKPARNRRERKA